MSFKSLRIVENYTSCIKCVGGKKVCRHCNGKMIKHGMAYSGKPRYKCKNCHKTQVETYTYKAYTSTINQQIITLTKEGLGIRSTARVLQIATATLLKRIIAIAQSIPRPAMPLGKTYQVDEIRTFLKCKKQQIWIVYALEQASKKVVSFHIGKRTNKTLNTVLKTLHISKAKGIYTDGLSNYRYLVARSIHKVKPYGTNAIERHNLTLRTHLKRLNRRTLCFSRSFTLLMAVLKIYFWGN